MGIQHTEGGQIQWSKELPQTCRLSTGLKLLLTPVIAGLLESKQERRFEEFFAQVEAIKKKIVIHAFSPLNWARLKIYINREGNLSRFQELIAEQTDIVSNNQLLIFDGQPLTELVKGLQPVVEYPKGITETNPVMCFNKVADESYKFPDFAVKDFPKFTSSVSPDDYPISKMCSGIACYTSKEVEAYVTKQCLLRRSVHIYVQELYHTIQHLMDYYKGLNRNCENTMKWKDNYERMTRRELEMVNLLPLPDVQAGEINAFVLELQIFLQESADTLNRIHVKVTQLKNMVSTQLEDLNVEQVEGKVLKNQWSDEHGCQTDDRCLDKMEVLVGHILKIKAKFNEDRKKQALNFNDEQIHKYDKNKLSEWCIKVKSLFHDHCFTRARHQYRQFLTWYRSAQACREQSEKMEKRLIDLAEEQERLAKALNEKCLSFHQKIDEFLIHLKSLDRSGAGPPRTELRTELSKSTKSAGEQPSRYTMSLVKQLISWLTENQKVVLETKQLVEMNSELVQKFGKDFSKDANCFLPPKPTSNQHF